MGRSASGRTRFQKLLLVVAVQVLVLVLAAGSAATVLAARGDADLLLPRVLRLPLQPVRDDASVRAVTEALEGAFPGSDISSDGEEIAITFEPNQFDLRRALTVVGRHGFQTTTFTLGRDFWITGLADGLATAVEPLAIMLVALPLVLFATGAAFRARQASGERRAAPGKIVILGLGGGILLALGVAALDWLGSALGHPLVEQPWVERVARSGEAAPVALLILAGVLLAPLGEEMFYRGWVFRYLRDMGAPTAYGVSALLFALVHLHPAALPAYLLLGIGLAALYDWSGSIWTPILAHATNNLLAIALLLV